MATPFPDKLRELLQQRNLTQEQFGRDLGLRSINLISYWTRGARRPSAQMMFKIARRLDCNLEWLVDDEMDEVPPLSGIAGLTEAQRIALVLVEDLGLDRGEAVRRLAAPVPTPIPEPSARTPSQRVPRRIMVDDPGPETHAVKPEGSVAREDKPHETGKNQEAAGEEHTATEPMQWPARDEEERPHEA